MILSSKLAFQYLDLFHNYLNGTVPSELGALTALTYLHLGGNSFPGTVPSELGSLTTLGYFALYGTSLIGAVLVYRSIVIQELNGSVVNATSSHSWVEASHWCWERMKGLCVAS